MKELSKTDIDRTKIVMGIQLYPNKLNDFKPSTYYQVSNNIKLDVILIL